LKQKYYRPSGQRFTSWSTHFGDEPFQAICRTGTDKLRTNKYTEKNEKKTNWPEVRITMQKYTKKGQNLSAELLISATNVTSDYKE